MNIDLTDYTTDSTAQSETTDEHSIDDSEPEVGQDIEIGGGQDSTNPPPPVDSSQTAPTIEDGNVLCGDSITLLDQLPENRFHAIVCDPPYNYQNGGVFGNEWDSIGSPKEYQEWCQEWSESALKTLKPGGHLIAFSGDTTHHRLFSGVQDAGYEIRHTFTWNYSQGFPKGRALKGYLDDEDNIEKWGEWRGKLKPAQEFAVIARSPFTGSATRNQVENGTGNLNVKEGEIPTDDDTSRTVKGGGEDYSIDGDKENFAYSEDKVTGGGDGRYPTNVAVDDAVGCLMNERNDEDIAKFFYTSKPSKEEKTHGGQLDTTHNTTKPLHLMEHLITLCTAEDQWVLDPFCGSGTTLLAAQNVARNSMGIDAEAEWVELTEKRLQLNELR